MFSVGRRVTARGTLVVWAEPALLGQSPEPPPGWGPRAGPLGPLWPLSESGALRRPAVPGAGDPASPPLPGTGTDT